MRRNVPSVDGARTPVNNRPIAPCRNRAMSSIESAPAIMPATSAGTFNRAFAAAGLADPDMRTDQVLQAGPFSELQDRRQAGARHEVGVIEDRGEAVRDSHPADALRV